MKNPAPLAHGTNSRCCGFGAILVPEVVDAHIPTIFSESKSNAAPDALASAGNESGLRMLFHHPDLIPPDFLPISSDLAGCQYRPCRRLEVSCTAFGGGRDVRAPGAACVTDWKVSYMLTQIEPLSEDSTAL